jgi:hypothetical protein
LNGSGERIVRKELSTDGDVAGSERIRTGTDHGPGAGLKAADEPLHPGCT